MLLQLRLRTAISAALLASAALFVSVEKGVAEEVSPPESEHDKILYQLGISVGRSLQREFQLTPEEAEVVAKGLIDTSAKREAILPDTYANSVQQLSRDRKAMAVKSEKVAAVAFLEEAAAGAGAERSESGLIITELVAGNGESPEATDKVKVHYHGTLRDGTVFDSSVERGQPAQFPLNRVIPCWTEGLQQIKVGGKSRLVCPPEIAYGDRGSPPAIPGGAVLTFEVELLEVVEN